MSDLGITGSVLRDAKAKGRAAFVGYLPVGFPTVNSSIDAITELARAADIVEIGIPYSDPVIDGPTIQRASTIALANGVRTRDVFTATEAVAAVGKRGVVMTYWNLVERYGVQAFARDLAAAGGAGLITPDLTPDEAQEWIAASDAAGLDRIFLIAPSSSDARIASTMDACRGWVYATAVMGVTGARTQTSSAAPVIVERARQHSNLPVGVGLGVSTKEQAAAVAQFADGVVVGSALVSCLFDEQSPMSKLSALAGDLAEGVRARA